MSGIAVRRNAALIRVALLRVAAAESDNIILELEKACTELQAADANDRHVAAVWQKARWMRAFVRFLVAESRSFRDGLVDGQRKRTAAIRKPGGASHLSQIMPSPLGCGEQLAIVCAYHSSRARL